MQQQQPQMMQQQQQPQMMQQQQPQMMQQHQQQQQPPMQMQMQQQPAPMQMQQQPGGGGMGVGGHDLQFDVSHNGVMQQQASSSMADNHAMSGVMDGRSGILASSGGGGSMTDVVKSIGFSQSAHPIICLFHILFKALALALYIFGGWFSKDKYGKQSGANFITVTVFCTLLLAADFWVVKNLTGRLLVGLRWWNKVEGETTRWIFESADGGTNNNNNNNNNANPANTPMYNPFDRKVFWWVLYITPFIWAFLFLIGLLKLELGWLINVVMALGLSFANLYGYYKCSNEQKERLAQMMEQGREQGAIAVLRSGVFGALSGVVAGLAGIRGAGGTTANQQQHQPQPVPTQATFA